MPKNNAVSQQPVYNQEGAADQDFRYHNDWDSGLCGCFDNCGICCCVFFCAPCYNCLIHAKAEECCATPIFCSHSLALLRTKVRTEYKIKGQIWKDICLSHFLAPCVMCQLANELRNAGINI